MQEFTILFKVGPPGLFGLPQDGMVVCPAAPAREFVGPVLDSRSGQFVSHGQLSVYRSDSDAINYVGALAGRSLTVRDNFFILKVEAEDRAAALRQGSELFEQFLRLLALEYGNVFTYETLQIESAAGGIETRPGPKMMQLFRGTIFDLSSLREHIESAAGATVLADARLSKALLYREHAALLFELRTNVGFFSPHFAFLLTSAFLNMWKAITTVLGEPGVDSDHQSRFLSFGLPKGYWQEKVKPLQDVRNAFDVAHYSLVDDAVQRVETSFGRAGEVCKEVLKAYVDHLVKERSQANLGLQPTAADDILSRRG